MMPHHYDPQNIFARILRGEIPGKPVLETPHSIAFPDISPQAPAHVLVLPRGAYVDWNHFAETASDGEIVDFTRAVAAVCRMVGAGGYRVISNAGADGMQEVPHLHVHVLAGKKLGPLIQR